MSRTFKDSLEDDLENVFFNTDEFAESVTLIAGQFQTQNVPAIVKERSYDLIDAKIGQSRIGTAVRSVDFDIIATKYRIKDQQIEPRDNHRLRNASGEEFQVSPLPGKQCFDPVSDGLVLRVHTKRISSG